jgi:outer membrane protein OmpA-like peptidoglycan-associated protein
MLIGKPVAWGASLTLLAGLAVGCCDQEKKQIMSLSGQNSEFRKTNDDLRAELAVARQRETDLNAQLDSRGLEVTALKTENADLKGRGGRVASAPSPHPLKGETGGEKTLYSVSIGSDVLFAPGSATLSAGGRKKLDDIAADIRGKHAGGTVRVMGYTDSDPIVRTRNLWQDNLDLSCGRAMAVTRYLIGKGLKAENVETIGMGPTHALAPNTSAAGKAKNRRVDISVVKR